MTRIFRTVTRLLLATWLAAGVFAGAAWAQSAPAEDNEAARVMRELRWLPPGTSGQLSGVAEFKASEKYTFLNVEDTDKFLKVNGNPPRGDAVTIAPTQGQWFGILSFADEGYIKDDESIDAAELLEALKAQNVAGNEAKRKQGYPTLELQGWALPPRYDKDNRRLEWGTLLRTDNNEQVVNVSTRILGRSGYTSAILVTSADTMETDLADFKAALHDFDYVAGQKYSEWREGDKVAAYGLGALVLGGAAAAVASKGGFKAIAAIVIGALAAAWTGLKKLLGRGKKTSPSA